MDERLRCFVIMPYSKTSDAAFEKSILPAIRDLGDVLVLRADRMTHELTLKAHVESAVASADFCIADLTDANPNVMYELGYAMAMQKPVLPIQDARSRRDIPSNLSGVSVLTYDRTRVEESRARLLEAARHLVASIRSSNRQTAAQGAFSADLLSDPAVLGRFVGSVRHSLSALVGAPEVLLREILPRLELASKPELLVRIVCADPEAGFAKIRANDANTPVAAYRSRLWGELQELRLLIQGRRRPRAELRLTSDIVATSLILSDDIALAFPYFAVGAGRDVAGMEVVKERAPREFDVLRRQFGVAWSQVSTGPPNTIAPRPHG